MAALARTIPAGWPPPAAAFPQSGVSLKKYFVLDTNVLLHNADSITSFADNTVVLPMSVIEEQDKFKSHNDELGRNARLKADAIGIEVMDFEKQKVNIDELYRGQRELLVPGSVIDEFYQKKEVSSEGLNLMPNEFVLLRDENDEKHTALTRA
ncbi:MAG: hypothetical protein CVU58_07535, partial [Deltaproteobacteria bacterium HGW-Deltaproteobacteria-16]